MKVEEVEPQTVSNKAWEGLLLVQKATVMGVE